MKADRGAPVAWDNPAKLPDLIGSRDEDSVMSGQLIDWAPNTWSAYWREYRLPGHEFVVELAGEYWKQHTVNRCQSNPAFLCDNQWIRRHSPCSGSVRRPAPPAASDAALTSLELPASKRLTNVLVKRLSQKRAAG